MTIAGRLAASYFVTVHLLYRYSVNIISVAYNFAPSCCFVQLFSRLIASRRIVLSFNFCRMLGNCFVVVQYSNFLLPIARLRVVLLSGFKIFKLPSEWFRSSQEILLPLDWEQFCHWVQN